MEWCVAAKACDLKDGETLVRRVAGALVALYRIDGVAYATDARCSHTGALLVDAYVEGDCVECPLHQALFHIPTGECRSTPQYPALRTYDVKIEGDDVLILAPPPHNE